MRGKVNYIIDSNYNMGITPAYAGKSFRNSNSDSIIWDHPRLCGEKLFALCYWVAF